MPDVSRTLRRNAFVVERKFEGQKEFTTVSPKIPARGHSKEKNWYTYLDTDISEKGFYYYRIKQFDLDGKEIVSEIVSIKVKDEFNIEVYPNPAVNDVNIDMILEEDVKITLSLYDNEGKFVRNLFEDVFIEKVNFNYHFTFKNEEAGLYNMVFQT